MSKEQSKLTVALQLDDMDYPKSPNQMQKFYLLAKKLAAKVIRNDE